jgi:hypothetical protein
MSYLGNAPARSFISFERQVFSIVNSQTAYALSHSVTNENDIRLVVNNVVQEPGSGKAYTATGTALTLSAALTNGTDEMYCVFLGRATATSAPGAGSIGTAQLASDAVTLAKMASGTDGNIISYDASGNPVAVATGNDGQVLTSAGAGAPPVFETPASATNTPALEATLGGSQAVSDGVITKLTFTSETFDSDGTFASSRFTPAVAGTYFVYFKGLTDPAAYANERDSSSYFYKNGSNSGGFQTNFMTGGNASADGATAVCHTNHGIFVLDDNDYIEVYGAVNTWNGNNGNFKQKVFGGYRIII